MSRQLAKRWITVEEYERMGEAGIFNEDDRLELLEGGIYERSPIGSRHAACVTVLHQLLTLKFAGKLIVISQNPIRLDDFSEPQPDIALLKWRDDFYRDALPMPDDVLLVIEVADTTIESDRAYKLPLYAKAGIAEVWIINLPDETIELYADAKDGTYGIQRNLKRGEDAEAHTIAGLRVAVTDVLG